MLVNNWWLIATCTDFDTHPATYIHLYYLSIIGLQIIGDTTLMVGQPANISCSTDFKVSSIQWVFTDDVVSTSTTQQVELVFQPVYDYLHSRVYTCRANSAYGVQEKTVVLTVIGKEMQSTNLRIYQRLSLSKWRLSFMVFVQPDEFKCCCNKANRWSWTIIPGIPIVYAFCMSQRSLLLLTLSSASWASSGLHPPTWLFHSWKCLWTPLHSVGIRRDPNYSSPVLGQLQSQQCYRWYYRGQCIISRAWDHTAFGVFCASCDPHRGIHLSCHTLLSGTGVSPYSYSNYRLERRK